MEESSNIGKNGIESYRVLCEIGYIYVPNDIDRVKFIQSCLRTKRVSIVTEGGQVFNNVPIDKNAINQIYFPNNSRKLGSPVGFMFIGKTDRPVVISVFDALDEFSNLNENQFSFERETETGSVLFSGKGDTGEMFIAIEGKKQVGRNSGGKLFINVKNPDSTALVDLKVDGDFNLETTGKISLKSEKSVNLELINELTDKSITNLSISNGLLEFSIQDIDNEGNKKEENKTAIKYVKNEGFSFTDEYGNTFTTKDKEIKFNTDKFILKSDKEAMVLGNTLSKLLGEFIDAVAAITTTTMLGAQPIINIAQVTALKSKVDTILSKHGYLE